MSLVSFNGQSKAVRAWEKELGFGVGTLRLRLLKGMSIHQAMTTPPIINMAHGHANHGKQTRAYFSWQDMKKRCYLEACKSYPNYGGRGITVCQEWRNNYPQFFADMGEPPAGMVLDRRDNDGNYCKANCRWVTREQSSWNRRVVRMISFMGQTKPAGAWERELGFGGGVIRSRLLRGMSVRDALTTPSGKRN